MYRRKHHQLIASCLHNFNGGYLAGHNILFGGGTRIALELDEYRESVDIDFLCGDKSAFLAVRQQVTNTSLGDLVTTPFSLAREIRFDRYGVRTFLNVNGINIKLEFVAFDNYQLKAGADLSLFPVPFIDRTSCFVTKLLANADRVGTKPFKDIFDLVVMYGKWGDIPAAAFSEAYSHYGKKVVNQSLQEALTTLSENSVEYAQAAAHMSIDARFYTDVILPNARKMLEGTNGVGLA